MIQEIYDSLTKRDILITVISFCCGYGVKFVVKKVKNSFMKWIFGEKPKEK